jgi:hypothetical protein
MPNHRDFFSYKRHAPEDVIEQFDDFTRYAAADWTLTTTEAGSGNATEALGSELGGVLVITNDDADNDKDAFQGPEAFKFTLGKRLQFVARFKLSDATACDVVIGLHITDTDPVGGVSDGIYFRKDAGDTHLDLVACKNSTLSEALDIAELADGQYVEVEFYYDGGDDKISAYVNGTGAGSVPLTNAPDDEEIALSFCIQNGAAAAKVMTIDYIGARQER